jgi:UDP-N-acetylglucosamine 3-dehydrogenase
MSKLGVGVIGTGHVAWVGHLPWYWENPDVEIRAISDVVEDSAVKAAHRWGVETWYTDYRDLLARDDIQAVSICTPTWTHREIAVAAAQAGKHILCEKPMARTVEECDAMLDAARQARVKLAMGFTKRCNPGFERIKQIIDNGLIGTPYHLDVHWNLYFPPGSLESKSFSEDARVGGGVLLDNGIHYIDTFRWWLNAEVDSIFAEISKVVPERVFEDEASAILRFTGGATAVLDMGFNRVVDVEACGWDQRLPYAWRFGEAGFVYGEKGTVYYDVPSFNSTEPVKIDLYLLKGQACELGGWHKLEMPTTMQPGGPQSPAALTTYAFKREIDRFVGWVLNDEQPPATGEDGRTAIQVVMAAYESARTGARVKVGPS